MSAPIKIPECGSGVAYLLISYSREQGQTTPRLTCSVCGRAEASVNYKGKQKKGKTESSGWKPNHMKKKSLNILIKNERRWSAGQGQGSSAQSGIISCGDFGHRSLKAENIQLCLGITEGPSSGKEECGKPRLKLRVGTLRNPSSPQALLPQPAQDEPGKASQSLLCQAH